MSAREYRSAAKGENWKFRLINTIDNCMHYAGNREEFIALMKSEGYAVRWEASRKSITYTTPNGMKCRDNNLHEDTYLKEVMEYEFRIRKQLIAQENAAGVEADESTAPADRRGAESTDHTYRYSVSGTRGSDSDAELHDGDAESIDANNFSAGTGWEEERKTYLQMAELASGLRPDASSQMYHAGTAHRGSTAGDGVRHSDSGQQHPKPVSMKPLHAGLCGLATAVALLDDEDDEDRCRRIQAEQEAKNIGAVISVVAGVAMGFTQNKPSAEEQQQA